MLNQFLLIPSTKPTSHVRNRCYGPLTVQGNRCRRRRKSKGRGSRNPWIPHRQISHRLRNQRYLALYRQKLTIEKTPTRCSLESKELWIEWSLNTEELRKPVIEIWSHIPNTTDEKAHLTSHVTDHTYWNGVRSRETRDSDSPTYHYSFALICQSKDSVLKADKLSTNLTVLTLARKPLKVLAAICEFSLNQNPLKEFDW